MLSKIWYTLCFSCRKNRSKTVRLAFPFVIIAAVLASAAILSEKQSYISINTEPPSVREGDVFFINIKAHASIPVNAVDIVLEYPELQIEVTGVDTGKSVITLWAEDPYAKNGSVYLRGGTFGKGFIGDHTIARIRAKAIQSGTAYVSTDSVRFVAGDGKGSEVKTEDAGLNKSKVYIANADGSLVGTASVKIITDVDGDGDVDLADISAFMAAWFKKDVTFDFNADGRMTFRDFSILLADSFFK